MSLEKGDETLDFLLLMSSNLSLTLRDKALQANRQGTVQD